MNSPHTRHEYVRPQEQTSTTWFNPLAVDQRVDVFYGTNGHMNERHPTRFVFKAGQSTEVPSRFDQAIQLVHCEEDECRRIAPGFCTKGHPGVILGGQAPQLRREGSRAVLAEALDPTLSEKKEKQAQLAAASIARTNAENTMLLAEARRMELEAEEKATAASRPPTEPKSVAKPKP